MSLNWWKSGKPKNYKSAPRAGKFGVQHATTDIGEENGYLYSFIPYIAIGVIGIGVLWFLHSLEWRQGYSTLRSAGNVLLFTTLGSTILLFLRSGISGSARQTYLTLTFAFATATTVIFLTVLPMVHGGEDIDVTLPFVGMWASYAGRVIFSVMLLISLLAEQSTEKEMRISITWFTSTAIVFVATALFGLTMYLPDHNYPIWIFDRGEELVPLGLNLMALIVLFRNAVWRQNRMVFHLGILTILYTLASIGILITPTFLHATEIGAYVFLSIATSIPFFSIVFSMADTYRKAERYKMRENWMTRGKRGVTSQIMSPTIFREIAHQLNEPMAITDENGQILFANAYLAEMTGLTEIELLQKTPAIWQHKSMPADFYPKVFQQIRNNKKLYEGEVKNAYPNNPEKSYDASMRITPVINEYGEITVCVVQQQNISKEKQRAHLMRQMIDTMPLGILLIDAKTRTISLINAQAEYLLSVAGIDLRSLKTLEDVTGHLRTIENELYPTSALPSTIAMEKRASAEVDNIAIIPEGKTTPTMVLKMKATPFFHEDNSIRSIQISLEDITKHREYEHKMSDFISVASHQLRTPLTSIKWSLDELRKKDSKIGKEDAQIMFDTCYEASDRMMVTIQQLLQVAELERGNIDPKSQQTDFLSVIDDVVTSLKALTDSKKINFKQSVLKTIPPLFINKFLLNQIAQNLLDNAMKYTPEGGNVDSIITVENDAVQWTLHDTGIGIAKENLAKVFQKFFRSDNAQRAHPDGTGLGLYIVKETLDAIGGSIRVESTEGEGTTMYVTIPLKHEVSGSTLGTA